MAEDYWLWTGFFFRVKAESEEQAEMFGKELIEQMFAGGKEDDYIIVDFESVESAEVEATTSRTEQIYDLEENQ